MSSSSSSPSSSSSSSSSAVCKPDQLGAFKILTDFTNNQRTYHADFSDVISWIPDEQQACRNVRNESLIKKFEVYRRYMPFYSSTSLDMALIWMRTHFDLIKKGESKQVDADFVCLRGSLTKIALSQYEQVKLQGFARKLKNTIYFIINKEPEHVSCFHDHMLKCMFGGYKFESMISKPIDSNSEMPFNGALQKEELCCVYTNTFGPYKVLYVGEVDTFKKRWSQEKLIKPRKAVELGTVECKTVAYPDNDKLEKNLQKKMVNWYVQSELIKCTTVASGFRNRNYQLRDVKFYSLSYLEKIKNEMMRGYDDIWDNLLKAFKLFSETITNCDQVFEFEYIVDSNQFSLVKTHRPDSFKPETSVISDEWLQFINN